MATYPNSPPHKRLNIFFGEFFRAMRKAPPKAYGKFLVRAEEEFKQLGYRKKTSAPVKNILVVRLDAIGDMILTSGFLRELRKNFPQAHITLVVSPLVFPIVEMCPYVNEVLSFDAKDLEENFLYMLEKVAVFCRDNLWHKKFSIAFCPQFGGNKTACLYLMWLSGARERIGYGLDIYNNFLGISDKKLTAQDNFLLTKRVMIPKNIIIEAEIHLYLLVGSGYKVNQTRMELFFDDMDINTANELLEDIPPNCKKIVLGIGAGIDSRKYPVEKYLVALNELAKKNLTFIIVGGKSELEDATYLEQNLPRGKVLNLVCKTTLRETEAVISQSDFYIGNDSGVMHMAAAAKIPVLAIYRDAKDKQNIFPLFYSESQHFPPYQTKSVALRPDHQLEDCAKLPPVYGWCHHENEPHCITQITPQEIIAGFEVLEGMV